ncbi:MAG: polysaccharide export outer membrane protein [Paracoccaceae bacterium]|jgi:polysaccharide export outer membrane protein
MVKYIIALVFAFTLGASVHAQGNYEVSVGDTLRVEVLEDSSLNRTLLVTPDGRISFPLAGTLTASGQTIEQIEQALIAKLSPNFASPPTVYVAVGTIPQEVADDPLNEENPTVYLLGEVNTPGPKSIIPGTTILQLLSQSGGFTDFAATKRIQIRKRTSSGSEVLITLNFRAISRGVGLDRDVVLQEGDVILVPERRLFE